MGRSCERANDGGNMLFVSQPGPGYKKKGQRLV